MLFLSFLHTRQRKKKTKLVVIASSNAKSRTCANSNTLVKWDQRYTEAQVFWFCLAFVAVCCSTNRKTACAILPQLTNLKNTGKIIPSIAIMSPRMTSLDLIFSIFDWLQRFCKEFKRNHIAQSWLRVFANLPSLKRTEALDQRLS